jgi:hypothetical protein
VEAPEFSGKTHVKMLSDGKSHQFPCLGMLKNCSKSTQVCQLPGGTLPLAFPGTACKIRWMRVTQSWLRGFGGFGLGFGCLMVLHIYIYIRIYIYMFVLDVCEF